MNNFNCVARLGRDPELKYFESGKSVVNFTVAVNVPYKRDETCWMDCEAWGKTGEIIAKYVSKGRQVALSGHLYQQKWEDKNGGGTRSKIVFSVQQVTLIGSREDGGTQQASADGSTHSAAPTTGDIPF